MIFWENFEYRQNTEPKRWVCSPRIELANRLRFREITV
jgi:hypothetical protein